MTEATNVNESVDVTDVLLNPQVQNSLNTVLENLPQLASILTALTKDEETLASLVTVVDSLPTLAKVVHLVDRVYRAAEDAVTDGDTLEGLTKMAQGYVQPCLGTVQKGRQAFEIAKERAEKDQTRYSVFSLLKMLKDPNVQKALRFTQAMLDALGEVK
ncbi:DUF1641 domain-containing protein [Alicyclobacillus fastidiosus]|uniref:DUF1641 domain-containing protein n=1 Tax=Alicyclobacillus fastidiosus TaxID=392011 RepID=A0ABY6ZK42_9BACL|nr:DUF1641 domain-containing protein [Alicyclobacillus fastidiosus]WAH43216.1 DUF1641 domain-containing protein [Alicyclobacillus fastidiosus]GMA65249.1 hypothetical protein GCM10025859_56890 [Alicyclobacillus fastidiosus]